MLHPSRSQFGDCQTSLNLSRQQNLKGEFKQLKKKKKKRQALEQKLPSQTHPSSLASGSSPVYLPRPKESPLFQNRWHSIVSSRQNPIWHHQALWVLSRSSAQLTNSQECSNSFNFVLLGGAEGKYKRMYSLIFLNPGTWPKAKLCSEPRLRRFSSQKRPLFNTSQPPFRFQPS